MIKAPLAVVVIESTQVDYASVDAFASQLSSPAGDGARPTIVDLSNVVRMGSIGFRALIEAAKTRSGFFGVVAPQATLREALEIGRVDAIVPIFDSLDAARAATERA